MGICQAGSPDEQSHKIQSRLKIYSLNEMAMNSEWILSTDYVSSFLTSLLVLIIVFQIVSEMSKKNRPPGPINLPILGHLPFVIGKNMEHVYMDLKKKYGDVVYIQLGSKQIVLLNSYETIKEALVLNTEVGVTRPEDFNALSYMHDNIGHILDNGQTWVENRRFLMRTLRDLGMGKNSLESEICEEATVLVKEIGVKCGQPIDVYQLITNASANVIAALLHGIRFSYSDPAFHELIDMFVATPTRFSPFKIVNSFPFIRFILPGFMSGMAELDEAKILLTKFMNRMISDHTTSEGEVQDYINLYLRQQKEELANRTSNTTTFTRERLRSNILLLNIAGIGTVAGTLYWSIKIIIAYPEIQNRLQAEIDRVIGSEKTPSYSDKINMPYTSAFLMEVQRYADIAPVGVPRTTKTGAKIAGYDIPIGATIMPLLFLVHKDPKIWGDPDNFRPERFIGKDGKTIASEYLIPFSTGKRNCPGKTLADVEMFMYLTHILQNFTFSPATIEDTEIKVDNIAFTRELSPFKVKIEPRNGVIKP